MLCSPNLIVSPRALCLGVSPRSFYNSVIRTSVFAPDSYRTSALAPWVFNSSVVNTSLLVPGFLLALYLEHQC